MSKPSVKEALANRKPDQAPVNLDMEFDPKNVNGELNAVACAQQEFELQQTIKRLGGGA